MRPKAAILFRLTEHSCINSQSFQCVQCLLLVDTSFVPIVVDLLSRVNGSHLPVSALSYFIVRPSRVVSLGSPASLHFILIKELTSF